MNACRTENQSDNVCWSDDGPEINLQNEQCVTKSYMFGKREKHSM